MATATVEIDNDGAFLRQWPGQHFSECDRGEELALAFPGRVGRGVQKLLKNFRGNVGFLHGILLAFLSVVPRAVVSGLRRARCEREMAETQTA